MNTMNRVINSLLLAASMLPAFANAADQYVRSGAVGRNDGTDWTNARTSLPSTLTRGDVYYIASGTYAGRTFNTATSGATPITIKKATVADHGTSIGWSDSYATGQASFTGGLSFNSSYWIIDGQTGGGAANKWVGTFGIKITETRDGTPVIGIGQGGTANGITIRHVDLQGKGSVSSAGGGTSNDGMAIWGASDVTLSYFRMSGIGRCPFFISPRNLIVEHGWIESYYGSSSVHSEAASIWGFSGNVGDVTFRSNLFTDIQSTGGIMWDNSSNTTAKLSVYGNIFYKPTGAKWGVANGLIGGWTGANGEQFRNAAVYNNTFINVDQESLSTLPNKFSGNVAYNNLFFNSQSPNFAKFANHDYNHFINSGDAHSEVHGSTATSGDPFVDFPNLDFLLKAPTASGMTLVAPFVIDPLGQTRGADGVTDRGAFEFDSTVRLAPPSNVKVM
jgi:hypothetical protein